MMTDGTLARAWDRAAAAVEEQAVAVDAEGRFPRQSIDALAEAGLLGLVSSTEVGGPGEGQVGLGPGEAGRSRPAAPPSRHPAVGAEEETTGPVEPRVPWRLPPPLSGGHPPSPRGRRHCHRTRRGSAHDQPSGASPARPQGVTSLPLTGPGAWPFPKPPLPLPPFPFPAAVRAGTRPRSRESLTT